MIDYQKKHNDFVSTERSLLIAPAGYGKTHTIAECLKYLKEQKSIENQLVLTHTHAGVASIKEKVGKVSPICKYHIETIPSFAQKYVEAFYCGEIPEQNQSNYFPFIIKKAIILFRLNPIKNIIKETYKGLFVDEYQDCTISQHNLIIALAEILLTHLLGDPLQGIFSFNGESLVDFESDLSDFQSNRLTEPWRWKDNNPELGNWLVTLKDSLEKKRPVDLTEINSIPNSFFRIVEDDDINDPASAYRKWLVQISFNSNHIKDLENTLIISHGTIWQRVELNQKLSYRYRLIEAFDEKGFYSFAQKFDDLLDSKNIYFDLITILKGNVTRKCKPKGKIDNSRQSTLLTGLSRYFKDDNNLPNPRNEPQKSVVTLIRNLETSPSNKLVYDCLKALSSLQEVKITRKELFSELLKAIKSASIERITVYEAMKKIRNVKRKAGRKVNKRSIGTTLLTKGLDFDTVVVLNAHKFIDPKNLYVALTRASKRLIVFANNNILTPYM